MNDNLVQQTEEREALSAIYGADWRTEPDSEDSYSIQVSREVKLFVELSPEYPSDKAPTYQLLAPVLTREQKQQIHDAFDEIYRESLGGPVLFQWIEKLKEVVNVDGDEVEDEAVEDAAVEAACAPGRDEKSSFEIVHGSIIQDRKSTFQGHVCCIDNQAQIKDVMNTLLQNKKVAQATHNILGYRIGLPNGSILQDFDDDGETHAGGRLLHLMQILDVNNVMVVVTRWYGGIHLGPDRSRHINNAARQVLQQAGLLKAKT